jgi:hypothetical protein
VCVRTCMHVCKSNLKGLLQLVISKVDGNLVKSMPIMSDSNPF